MENIENKNSINNQEIFYRTALMQNKLEQKRIERKKYRAFEAEMNEKQEKKNSKWNRFSSLKRIKQFKENLSKEKINKPRVNLASQVKTKHQYSYDGAVMAADEDFWNMPDIAGEMAKREFDRIKKETVKKGKQYIEKAQEAKRAKQSVQAAKGTYEAAKAAKGAKSIGLFLKSALTLASLESFGISLLIQLAFTLVQAILYYVFGVEAMKLEWYDWILLGIAATLLIIIFALLVIIIAEYLEYIEIGIWVVEQVSNAASAVTGN